MVNSNSLYELVGVEGMPLTSAPDSRHCRAADSQAENGWDSSNQLHVRVEYEAAYDSSKEWEEDENTPLDSLHDRRYSKEEASQIVRDRYFLSPLLVKEAKRKKAEVPVCCYVRKKKRMSAVYEVRRTDAAGQMQL